MWLMVVCEELRRSGFGIKRLYLNISKKRNWFVKFNSQVSILFHFNSILYQDSNDLNGFWD